MPPKPAEKVELSQIAVGQKIWATVVIPKDGLKPDAMKAGNSKKSTTSTRIASGLPVDKQLVVLKNNGDTLTSLYSSTFGGTPDLTTHVKDPAHWYPVAPATNKDKYPVPLPKEPNNTAQWICCSNPVTVDKNAKTLKVLKGTVYSQDSVNLLKNKVNEINGKNVV